MVPVVSPNNENLCCLAQKIVLNLGARDRGRVPVFDPEALYQNSQTLTLMLHAAYREVHCKSARYFNGIQTPFSSADGAADESVFLQFGING